MDWMIGVKVLSTMVVANLLNRHKERNPSPAQSWITVRVIGPLRLKRDKRRSRVGQKLITYQPAEPSGVFPEQDVGEPR